jgi:hypothetical protein
MIPKHNNIQNMTKSRDGIVVIVFSLNPGIMGSSPDLVTTIHPHMAPDWYKEGEMKVVQKYH